MASSSSTTRMFSMVSVCTLLGSRSHYTRGHTSTGVPMSIPQLRLAHVILLVIVNFIFLRAVICYAGKARTAYSFLWSGSFVLVVLVYFVESRFVVGAAHIHWVTSTILACTSLSAGWFLWNSTRGTKGHGARLLAGLFLLLGLHGTDRPLWSRRPLSLLLLSC